MGVCRPKNNILNGLKGLIFLCCPSNTWINKAHCNLYLQLCIRQLCSVQRVVFFENAKSFLLLFSGVNRRLVIGSDLYSTVNQSCKPPQINNVRQEEERGNARATCSMWWACLRWHHCDRVWLVCLTAHKQHWCLELDRFYAAVGNRRSGVSLVDSSRQVRHSICSTLSHGHAEWPVDNSQQDEWLLKNEKQQRKY